MLKYHSHRKAMVLMIRGKKFLEHIQCLDRLHCSAGRCALLESSVSNNQVVAAAAVVVVVVVNFVVGVVVVEVVVAVVQV
jgi:hypothetical protein